MLGQESKQNEGEIKIESKVYGRIDFVDQVIERLPERLKRIADKTFFGHYNFTIRKAISFGIVSLIGGVVLLGITYTMTEFGGKWYMYSALVGGAVGVVVKFILNSVFTYRDKEKESKCEKS
jgi:hypothetical protein